MSTSNGVSRWLAVAVLGVIVVVSASVNYYLVQQALAAQYAAIAALLAGPSRGRYDTSSGPDSPIKVRGGTITLLTNIWTVNRSNPKPSLGPYCTSIPFSTLDRTGFDNDAQDSKVLALGDTNLWTIKLYRSLPDGTPDRAHGVIIRKAQRCLGDTTNLGVAVTIAPLGSGDMFDPIPGVTPGSPAEQSLDGLHYRQYSNNSCGTSGTAGPCNQIAGIDIASDKITQSLGCSHHTCTIGLGNKPGP
jgi:hypothetical protein